MLQLCRLADVSDNLNTYRWMSAVLCRCAGDLRPSQTLDTGGLLLCLCRPTSPRCMPVTAAHWLCAHWAHMQSQAGHGVMSWYAMPCILQPVGLARAVQHHQAPC